MKAGLNDLPSEATSQCDRHLANSLDSTGTEITIQCTPSDGFLSKPCSAKRFLLAHGDILILHKE